MSNDKVAVEPGATVKAWIRECEPGPLWSVTAYQLPLAAPAVGNPVSGAVARLFANQLPEPPAWSTSVQPLRSPASNPPLTRICPAFAVEHKKRAEAKT